MGQISLTLPTVGQPNTTEAPKIVTDFTTIQNVINGNIDYTNLSTSLQGMVVGPKALVFQASGLLTGGVTTGDYYALGSGGFVPGSSPSGQGTPLLWPGNVSADFDIPGKNTYIELRATTVWNANVGAGNPTIMGRLFQINGVASGNSTVGLGITPFLSTPSIALGSLTAGVSTSTATTLMPNSSSAPFALGVNVSAAVPTNGAVGVTLQVLAYHA